MLELADTAMNSEQCMFTDLCDELSGACIDDEERNPENILPELEKKVHHLSPDVIGQAHNISEGQFEIIDCIFEKSSRDGDDQEFKKDSLSNENSYNDCISDIFKSTDIF
ncbi:hypothetical protein GJ496_008878 [Pomphorhynchus laevis]|nr:hypothetical protein GJ496_008878 [Pomphorhynchus laevis]